MSQSGILLSWRCFHLLRQLFICCLVPALYTHLSTYLDCVVLLIHFAFVDAWLFKTSLSCFGDFLVGAEGCVQLATWKLRRPTWVCCVDMGLWVPNLITVPCGSESHEAFLVPLSPRCSWVSASVFASVHLQQDPFLIEKTVMCSDPYVILGEIFQEQERISVSFYFCWHLANHQK
jgi:hypothetical protein